MQIYLNVFLSLNHRLKEYNCLIFLGIAFIAFWHLLHWLLIHSNKFTESHPVFLIFMPWRGRGIGTQSHKQEANTDLEQQCGGQSSPEELSPPAGLGSQTPAHKIALQEVNIGTAYWVVKNAYLGIRFQGWPPLPLWDNTLPLGSGRPPAHSDLGKLLNSLLFHL